MGSVEVIVFPKDYEANRELFVEDEKLFIRGRVSIGEDPVGKLVCEKVWKFSQVPRELWVQFEDLEDYRNQEQKLLTVLRSSEGGDRVIIYLKKERAKKVLPENWNVAASRELIGSLSDQFGEKNIKVVEKSLKS